VRVARRFAEAFDGWRDEVPLLQAEGIRLTVQRRRESVIQRLKAVGANRPADPAAALMAVLVDGWRELRSRYDSAADIPVRHGELAAKRDVVADSCAAGREGEADPRRLPLPAPIAGALED